MKTDKYKNFILIVSLVIATLSFSVLIGWLLNIPLLTGWLGNKRTMKFNTALALFSLSAVLFIQVRATTRAALAAAKGLSLFTLVLGILNLVQYLFGYNLGIDELVVTDTISTTEPSRMAEATAFCATVLSAALLAMGVKRKAYVLLIQWSLHLITLLSLTALVGYLFNVPGFLELRFFSSLAVITALCFFFLSIAASLFNPDAGMAALFTRQKLGNEMVRQMVIPIVIMVLGLGFLRLWANLYNLFSADFGVVWLVALLILGSFLIIERSVKKLNQLDAGKTEAEINLSRLKIFLDSTPDPILLLDGTGMIRLANKRAETTFGYSFNQMAGRDIKMLVPERLHHKMAEYRRNFLEAPAGMPNSWDLEIDCLKIDGSEFPAEVSLNRIETGDGVFLSVDIRDVSARRVQQLQLNRLATIINSSVDAIISKKVDGTILTWNKGAEEIMGYTANEAVGKHISILFPPELLQEEEILIAKILGGEHVDQYETIRVKKDGSLLPVSITLSPIRNEQGNIVAVSKILRDITRQKNAELELYQSNERNRIFVEQSPNALAMFDTEMRYMAASRKWKEDYHLTGVDIIGRSHYEVFPKITEDRKAIHRRVLAGGIDVCPEAYFEHSDGSPQWVTWDMRPWYIAEGQIGGMLMYTADITELKQKDAERRRIERILDRTNHVARIATWEIDVATGKATWGPLASLIFEVPPKEQNPERNYNIGKFLPVHSREKIVQLAAEQMKDGRSYDVEIEIVTAKGNIKWLRVIGEAEFESGVCKRRFGVFQDITKAKQAQHALNVANTELKAIFNAGYVSIISSDVEGLITHFNQGAEVMLQYTAAEMVGRQTPAVVHLPEEIERRGKQLSKQYGHTITGFDVFVERARHGEHESREWTYVRKDGTQFPVQLIVSAIRNSSGTITGFLGVATDITERKAYEQKLRNYSILEAKSKEMEQFAYVTSHDLREPLLTIKNYVQLLLEDYGEHLQGEDATFVTGSITRAVWRMEALIQGLLDYSRLSQIKQLQIVDCNQVMADVIADLNSLITNSKATVKVQMLPTLNAYPLELKLLLQNLVNNAIKFRKKEVAPIVEILATPISGGWQFCVADNGIGINEAYRQKIFSMFQRLHTREEYEGTGIGLAQCKKIAELHNGQIWVESEVGLYSKFCFTILT